MSDVAYQTQYRQEFIAGFEQKKSLLLDTVTTEAVIKGNQAVFLVADSGSAVAQTRGVNGRIPARADSETQNTCVLQEWHDLVRKTGFNIFASQGNQRAMMQDTSMGVINRKADNLITTQLETTTVTVGATGTIPNVSLFMNALVKLGNASVPWDSNVTMLCQPSFLAYMMQAPEFTAAEYVDLRPYAGQDPNWRDKPQAYRWMNTLVIAHPNLAGKGTSAEHSYLYHKSAIGCAMNTGGIESEVGFDREDAYSWARTTVFAGAKVLQTAGIVELIHDGSAYA